MILNRIKYGEYIYERVPSIFNFLDIVHKAGGQATHVLGNLLSLLLAWLHSVLVHDGGLKVQCTLAPALLHEQKLYF